MKVCFISKQLLVHNNSGGHYFSEMLCKTICRVCGEDNVAKIVIIPSQEDIKHTLDLNTFIYRISNNGVLQRLYCMFGRECYSQKVKKDIVNDLKRIDADYYFFDGSWHGSLSKYIKNKTCIVFYHNIEKLIFFNARPSHRKLIDYPYYISTCINEKTITRNAKYRICLNNRDDMALKKIYGFSADVIIPIFLKDRVTRIYCSTPSKKILFVGSLYLPNVEGITWFCKEVAPKIKYEIDIIGLGMEKIKDEIQAQNVNVIGTVDDISIYYQHADAVIAPIFSGGGMKVKIVEALMFGKRILATNEALEGFGDYINEDIMCCNSASDFIDKLNYLYDKKTSTFSENNRNIFLENYSDEAIYARMLKIFQ